MEKIVDLHIHTNCSDGEFTPFEVIDFAYKNRLNTISITDHDTIAAYSRDLIEYAKLKNINLISGVEISAKINKFGIHVLGYNFDINNNKLNSKLNKLRKSRHNYLFNVAKKLNKLGYLVNTEKLKNITAVTKAHIALDIVNNFKNKELLIKNFNHVPSKGEFIEMLMNEGCPAYVEKDSITPVEAARLIKKAGGKVVLAHPVAYTYEDNMTVDEIKNILDLMKADGIEAYYIYIDRKNNKHNDIDKWKKFANDNGKFVTVGSDFHFKDKIHPIIGLLNEGINIPLEEINQILKEITK